MATEIKLRRGTKAQHDDGSGFTGAEGEVTVDTTDDTLRVHDGSLKGGHVIAKLSDVEASDTLAELLAKGNSTGSNDIQVDGTDKVTFGAESGGKLEIYEDGSQNGVIKQTGTGALKISGIYGTLNNDSDEELISWDTDNAGLSWRGASGAGLKLFTKETGIGVTGTVNASDGLTADYIDLTGGKSTTTTGAICADQIRFSAEGSDEAKIYASVDGLNTSLFIQSNDDEADKVRVVAGGTESLTVSKTGIDVTGTVKGDSLTIDNSNGLNTAASVNSSTGRSMLNVISTFEGTVSEQEASIEIGANKLAFIDFKTPDTDDYDLRIYHSEPENLSMINSLNDNLFLRSGAKVALQHAGANTKLETTATGIDVTGTVSCDTGISIASNADQTDPQPDLNFFNNEDDAVSQRIGQLNFYGKNNLSGAGIADVKYGWQELRTINVTDGEESAQHETWVKDGAGGNKRVLQVQPTGIDVTGTVTCDEALTISSTGAAADAKPDIWLFNNAPAAVDERLGQITWYGKNDVSPEQETVNYAFQEVKTTNVGDGTEQAEMQFHIRNGAHHLEVLTLDSSGIDVTGTVTADGVSLGDNEKIQLGADGDLKIYHNGSHSKIEDTGTGNLVIEGTEVSIKDSDGNRRVYSENGNSGSARLYYGNDTTEKLSTTSAGIDVTGTVTADGVALGNNEKITFGGESDGKLEIYESTGGNGFIEQTGDGNLSIKGQDITLSNNANQTLIKTILNTAQLYHRNGDNEGLKLETTNNGIDVTGKVECKDTVAITTTGSKTDPSPDLDFINLHADAIGERLGQINYYGMNDESGSGSGQTKYAWTEVRTIDVTEDSEKAQHETWVKNGASHSRVLQVQPTGIDVTGAIECDTSLQIQSSGSSVDAMPDLYMTNLETADDAQNLGMIHFRGYNDASTPTIESYANIYAQQVDVSDGAEKGKLVFQARNGAGYVEALQVTKDGIDVTGTVEADSLTTGDTTINGNLEVKSTTADGNFLPEIRLKRDGGVDAGDDGDVLGALVFEGDNFDGTQKDYARIGVSIKDDGTGVTDGRVKGEIRFACADGTASPTLEQPSCSIDSTGVHINSDPSDGTSNYNYYHVDNVNLAGVQSGGLKFNSRTEDNAANKTTQILSKNITEDHEITVPNVTGTLVVASIAGGSINGGDGTTTPKSTWSESNFTANPNSTYLHYNPLNTTDLTVSPEYPATGLGDSYKFLNASPQASDIIIDLDGYSGSSVASYALVKTDGSLNATINTSSHSTITVSSGGFVTLTKVAFAVYLVEGIGYTYS